MSEKQNDLTKSVNGTAWLTIATVVDYALNLVVTYVLARLLSPSDYGIVAAITTLVGFADIFWQLGVGTAVVQKRILSSEDISTGHYINGALGIAVFAVISVFSSFWQDVFSIESRSMLCTYSIIFIIQGFMAIPQAKLQRECNFKALSFSKILGFISYTIFVILFALMEFGPWALIFGALVKESTRMIYMQIASKISWKIRLSKNSARELLFFGGGLTIGKLFNYVATNGDYFVINKTLGSVELGTYNKAYNLLMYPANLVGNMIEQVLFPIFSRNQDNKEKIRKAYISGNSLIAVVTIPISIVSYMVASDLILFFLGENWVSAILPFKIMIVGLFFRTAYKLSNTLIKAVGRVYLNSFIQLVYAIMVVCGAYFGHYYGLKGVALGVTIAFTTNYFLQFLFCAYCIRLDIKKFLLEMAFPISIGIFTSFVVFFISKLWINISNHFAVCCICTIVTFLVYYILFAALFRAFASDEMKYILGRFIDIFAKKIGKK